MAKGGGSADITTAAQEMPPGAPIWVVKKFIDLHLYRHSTVLKMFEHVWKCQMMLSFYSCWRISCLRRRKSSMTQKLLKEEHLDFSRINDFWYSSPMTSSTSTSTSIFAVSFSPLKNSYRDYTKIAVYFRQRKSGNDLFPIGNSGSDYLLWNYLLVLRMVYPYTVQ